MRRLAALAVLVVLVASCTDDSPAVGDGVVAAFEGDTLTDVEARVIAEWYATELDEAVTVWLLGLAVERELDDRGYAMTDELLDAAARGLSELPNVDVENVDPVAARVRAASLLLDEAAAAAVGDEATIEQRNQWIDAIGEAATARVDANAEIDPEFGTLVPGSAQVRGS